MIDKRIMSIIARSVELLLPRSLDYSPTCATNGLFFTTFNLGVNQEFEQDTYWFWLLEDVAELGDNLCKEGIGTDNHVF